MKSALVSAAVLLVFAVMALVTSRATRFRTGYVDDVGQGIERVVAEWPDGPPVVTDDDLAPLPAPVQKYLRRAGVVGKPRVVDFHVELRGRFRMGRGAAWMKTTADQYELFGAEPTRLFFMKASRAGVPFVGFHRYADGAATMDIRLLGAFRVAAAQGDEMTQSETVTLFNDMCVLAPATLAFAKVRWQPVSEREVKATFANAGHTISAVLTFDAAGDLVNFVSYDRYQSDGKTSRLLPWSTPLANYRDLGAARVAATAEARWREPDGAWWAYGEFAIEQLEYNVGVPRR